MWAKIDDKLCTHPKFVGLPLAPRGLWVTAMSWSCLQRTDGFIPTSSLRLFGAQKRDARRLVEAGMWEESDDGWLFHDWDKYQPSAQEAAQREQDVARKRAIAGSLGGSRKASNRAKSSSKPSSKPLANRKQNPSPEPEPIELLRSSLGGGVEIDDQMALVPAATAAADASANTKKNQKGTRLPDGWFPDRTDAALKLEAAHDNSWLERELDRFRDYWQSKAGQQATKLDWTKTWCNWLRSAEDRQPRSRQKETDDWYSRSQQRAAAGVNVFTEMMKEAQK